MAGAITDESVDLQDGLVDQTARLARRARP
jgi:hypothetical protein